MSTSKFTVTVKISKEDACKAGLAEYGEKDVIVDPGKLTESQRKGLLGCFPGDPYRLPQSEELIPQPDTLTGWDQASAAKLLDRVAEHLDTVAARRGAAVQCILDTAPSQWLEQNCWDDWKTMEVGGVSPVDYPDARLDRDYVRKCEALKDFWAKVSALQAERQRKVDEERKASKESHEREVAEAKAKAEAKAEARRAQLDKWVRGFMPEHLDRHEAGFMPENEILDHMREDWFRALDKFPRYHRMTATEVVQLSDFEADVSDVSFTTEDSEHVTSEIWSRYQDIFHALPQDERAPVARFDLRVHLAEVYHKTVESRFTVLVTQKQGEIELSREYSLESGDYL